MKRNLKSYRSMVSALLVPLTCLETVQAQQGPVAEPTQPASEATAAAPAGVEASEQLTPPQLLKEVQPEYPSAAKEKRLAAVVVLEIDIDAAGKVELARVVQPAQVGGYGFDEAAIKAAYELSFSPAVVSGQAVPVRISYRFRFEPAALAPQVGATRAQTNGPNKAPQALAQGELGGKLLERGTRNPLSGVKVTAFRGEGESAQGFETESNEKGEFHFERLVVGEWKLLADPEGYYPVRVSENVEKGTRTSATYYIEKKSYNPYDVTVETERVRREVSHTAIVAEQAERMPGSFGDVLKVVQNFPGVARTPAGQLVVRGSAPEDSQTLVSDIQIPIIYHFGGLRGVMPVGMVERIDFYPGNFSVEYGRATGAIVDVGLKQLHPNKVGGYLDVNLFDTSLYLEAPVTDKFSIAIAARRSYIDTLLSALPEDDVQMVAPRYSDIHALASYRPSAAHHIQAFFFTSADKFEAVFKEPEVADATTVVSDIGYGMNFYRGIAEYSYVPSRRFSNEMKVSFGRDTSHFSMGSDTFVDYKVFQGQVRDTARYQVNNWLALRGGVDYLFERVDYSLKLPPPEDESIGTGGIDDERGATENITAKAEGTTHSTAGFFEVELAPIKQMLLIPGVRVEHFSRTAEFAVSPRFTARQGLGKRWAIKGGVGLFVQEPLFEETDADMGNPDLGLEKAMHYSAGVEYRPLPHIELDLTGFYKTLHHWVSPVATDVSTGEYDRYSNDGAGRVLGLEVSARHQLANNFYGWVSYTLSRAERKEAGSDEYELFDYDQTHILTLIGAYQLPHNWEISSRFRFVTGNLYTPVNGSVYDADTDSYLPISGKVNSERLAPFHQLDFRIDKRWIYEHWILGAYLDIQNVYNREQENGVSYNFDYSETSQEAGVPLLPVIGIRGEF